MIPNPRLSTSDDSFERNHRRQLSWPRSNRNECDYPTWGSRASENSIHVQGDPVSCSVPSPKIQGLPVAEVQERHATPVAFNHVLAGSWSDDSGYINQEPKDKALR